MMTRVLRPLIAIAAALALSVAAYAQPAPQENLTDPYSLQEDISLVALKSQMRLRNHFEDAIQAQFIAGKFGASSVNGMSLVVTVEWVDLEGEPRLPHDITVRYRAGQFAGEFTKFQHDTWTTPPFIPVGYATLADMAAAELVRRWTEYKDDHKKRQEMLAYGMKGAPSAFTLPKP